MALQPAERSTPGLAGPAGEAGPPPPRRRRGSVLVVALSVLLVATIVVAVAVGQAQLSPAHVWSVLMAGLGAPGLMLTEVSAMDAAIVVGLRLPRVLAAAVVGAGLAVVGAVLQTLTRNPMADPFLLGISSGASLGAVLIIVLGLGAGAVGLPAGAFVGGLVAFVLVLLLSAQGSRLSPLRVVLAGVAVAQFAAALTALVIIWAAVPQATQRVQHWLAGSLAQAGWVSLVPALVVLALVMTLCLWHAASLDAFAFGEDAAASLGIEVIRVRWVLLVATAALTGTLVAISGTIGFVGLILPHAVRFVAGADHRRLLPLCALSGAIFLIGVDTLARTAFAPRELPVGLVTALVGVPVFALLLRRVRLHP